MILLRRYRIKGMDPWNIDLLILMYTQGSCTRNDT
jgi:hypothetical protein